MHVSPGSPHEKLPCTPISPLPFGTSPFARKMGRIRREYPAPSTSTEFGILTDFETAKRIK
jgi:hypothetical protein